MTKELVKEKVARHDGSQENSLPPVELTFVRGRVGVGGSLTMGKYEPRPCGCNTRKLVNNRFPAHKGWGLRGDNPQSLINVKGLFAYSLICLFTFINHFTHLRKRCAFTLAEVLIILGVIGIVAAMTIPTLINNYQEKVTVTKVKKMYSTLNQAVKLAEVDNGSVSTWDLPNYANGGSQKLYGYLKPYLKVSKECVEDNSGNCLDTSLKYYLLNGSVWSNFNPSYGVTYYGGNYYVRIILADGSLLWFRTTVMEKSCGDIDAGYTDVCGMLWYDVNGNAAPNRMAKDIFVYYLRPSGIYPHRKADCYLNDSGWGCAKWILDNENMDYPATKSVEK